MAEFERKDPADLKKPVSGHSTGWLISARTTLANSLSWLFSTKGDGPIHDARRAILSAALPTVALAVLSPFMFRFPIIRWLYFSTEKFSGRYVQIIFGRNNVSSNTAELGLQIETQKKVAAGVNIYYSMIEITYDTATKNYVLNGFQFNENGDITTTFISNIINLKLGPRMYFEFIWETTDVSLVSPDAADTNTRGYTYMQFYDRDPVDTCSGKGFFIGFRPNAQQIRLSFFRLSPIMIKRLGVSKWQQHGSSTSADTNTSAPIQIPRGNFELSQFIRALHSVRSNPDNQYLFGNTEAPAQQ